ncbi:MAG: DUF3467 domain-containing protein [Patescibacteria group bacterium]|jgi:hypothetical protein
MSDPQPQQIPIDGHAHALMNTIVNYDEEQFQLLMMSGGPARLYMLSPKHAKRLMLLLQKQLADYEAKFGELKTALAQVAKGTTSEEEVGFNTKK